MLSGYDDVSTDKCFVHSCIDKMVLASAARCTAMATSIDIALLVKAKGDTLTPGVKAGLTSQWVAEETSLPPSGDGTRCWKIGAGGVPSDSRAHSVDGCCHHNLDGAAWSLAAKMWCACYRSPENILRCS